MNNSLYNILNSEDPVMGLLLRKEGRKVFTREEEQDLAERIEIQEKKLLGYIWTNAKNVIEGYYKSHHRKIQSDLEDELSTSKSEQYKFFEKTIEGLGSDEQKESFWEFYRNRKDSEHLREIVKVTDSYYDTMIEDGGSIEVDSSQNKTLKMQKYRISRLHQHWINLRDEFMSANYGLVITIAKRYRRNNGLDFKDLIQEGNVGLIKSIDKFDYSLGYKFSTYASWWIRQSITRSIADNGRTIRLPVYIFDDLRKYLRAETDYLSLHGEIDPEIIAREQNIDPEKIKRNLKASLDPISLNASFGEDQRTELIDLIENENRISPEEEAIQNALKRTISEVLSLQLSEKEQSILHLRYGIGNEQDLTLEEVGDMFNLTRERIRQIQEKALRTLRRKGAEELIQFYEE